MAEVSEAQKVIAAALDQGIVAAMDDSGWVSNIEDDEGAVIPTTIRVDGVIDLTALAARIDQALGGLTRDEQWVPVEESGHRWEGRHEAGAMYVLDRFGADGPWHDSYMDSPVTHIDHECRFVSGWTEVAE